jgi:subtilisin family serine protease
VARRSGRLLCAAALLSSAVLVGVRAPVAAAPEPVDGPVVEGLIVRYAPGVSAATAEAVIEQMAQEAEVVEPGSVDPGQAIGFGLQTVELDGPVSIEAATELADALEASPLVLSAEPDIAVQAFDVQVDPPWNLDRIDQRSPAPNGSYRYQHTGAGVRVYVVDSGVRADHRQFGRRVVAGFSATVLGGDGRTDPYGHGTHVAGTVAGSTYGVAKQAMIVPVQVLGATGWGSASDVITGLDWIVDTHPAGTPGVVNLSFGADLDYFLSGSGAALDAVVRAVLAAGLTVVIAAGNGDPYSGKPKDACGFTPARVTEAITVAASRTTGNLDLPAAFTNFGPCTDIFAPGVNVLSAGRISTTATTYLSGTSMAAPHVAGVAAQLLQTTPTMTPAQVWEAIEARATTVEISDRADDPDLMVYTEGSSAPAAPSAVAASVGDGSIVVTWTAPSDDGGSPVAGYTARAWDTSAGGAVVSSCSPEGAATTCTVEGLVNGTTYYVDVVAGNDVGTSPASAPRLAARPGIPVIGTPTVVGTVRYGATLTARPGTWGPSPVGLSFNWLRDGAPIEGATSATYVPGVGDIGHRLGVAVTASKDGYGSLTRFSAQTAPVVGLSFSSAPWPVVRGTARYGSTLTASIGTWGPAPVSTSITWLRNGVPVAGATGTTYVLGLDDIGARMSVAVSGSRPGYTTVSRTSSRTAAVAALRFTIAPTLRLVGSTTVGSTLTVQAGAWGPGSPTLSYSWLRNGVPVAGATGTTYVVAPGDRGARLSARVIATQLGYASSSRTSWATSPVTVAARVARDGAWTVGAQVAVDSYITATATALCTWERRGSEGAPPGALLADDRGSGQRIVTVGADDAVLRTSGCGRWYRLADIAPSPRPTIPGGGVYSVAHHIVPGTYRASTPGGRSCYWARLSGFGGAPSDVLESAVTTAARPVVVIDSSTTGFEATAGCGTWTRIG